MAKAYECWEPSGWRRFWRERALSCFGFLPLFWAFEWMASHPSRWCWKCCISMKTGSEVCSTRWRVK